MDASSKFSPGPSPKPSTWRKEPNPRFIVTSLSAGQATARKLYEQVYCARGESPENRIKEQQLGLFADRTSTGRMWSNQLRLYFSSIAYVLLHTLRRLALAGTELERAQCGTIWRKLPNIGAQVRVTVRKVWLSLAEGYPWRALFTAVIARLEPDVLIGGSALRNLQVRPTDTTNLWT